MQYLIVFLEGIITFISPCMLPMLPIYVSYFSGSEGSRKTTMRNALGFVLGFTTVFIALGAFAATAGRFLLIHARGINLITGLVVLLFGLNYLGVLKFSWLQKSRGMQMASEKLKNLSFGSAFLFGVIFSVSWSPCVGAFLGSALMMASTSGSSLTGIVMLLCFSLGLGIPFLISSLLLHRLKHTFAFIKRNYRTVQLISGSFLVLIGIAMMTGLLQRLLRLLTF